MARASQKRSDQGRLGATGGTMPPTDARLDEIARILALGILRLQARMSASDGPANQSPESDFALDFLADQSVHAGYQDMREKDDD